MKNPRRPYDGLLLEIYPTNQALLLAYIAYQCEAETKHHRVDENGYAWVDYPTKRLGEDFRYMKRQDIQYHMKGLLQKKALVREDRTVDGRKVPFYRVTCPVACAIYGIAGAEWKLPEKLIELYGDKRIKDPREVEKKIREKLPSLRRKEKK